MKKCHFCPRVVDAADCYCYGCKTVVCDECDVSMGRYIGGHAPEVHLEEPESFAW